MVSVAELAKFANDLVKEKWDLEQEYIWIKEKMAQKQKELEDFEQILKNREKQLNERWFKLDKDEQSTQSTKQIIESMKLDAQLQAEKGSNDIEVAKKIRKELLQKENQLNWRADQLQRQELDLIRRSRDIQMKENNFILLMESNGNKS